MPERPVDIGPALLAFTRFGEIVGWVLAAFAILLVILLATGAINASSLYLH